MSGTPSRDSSTASGRSPSTWAHTIISATMIGTARNIPATPHTAAQKASESRIPKEESRSARPSSSGSSTIPTTNWIEVSVAIRPSVSTVSPVWT